MSPRSARSEKASHAIDIGSPLTSLRGIGPKRARALAEAGFLQVKDLLFHLPRGYEDRRRTVDPGDVTEPGLVTLEGRLRGLRRVFTRRRSLRIVSARVEGERGDLRLVWFNQPYLLQQLPEGARVLLHGEVKVGRDEELELVNASWQRDPQSEGGGVVPVYAPLAGLGRHRLRSLLSTILEQTDVEAVLAETIPGRLLRRHRLPTIGQAVRGLHAPSGDVDVEALVAGRSPYHQRLIYGELLRLRARLELARGRLLPASKPHRYRIDDALRRRLDDWTPFCLTEAQERALGEILGDLESHRPMQRLLHGDVGCGKTIVAVLALAVALESGLQGALMAPTEILAEQHFLRLRRLLPRHHRLGLYTGSSGKSRGALRRGEVDLAIGTHALIQERLRFARLGLVVIDEQQRFGVGQRRKIVRKGGQPDLLVMTATPIPRSLALTVYGDLDVSLIDESPPGRAPVTTRVLPRARRPKVYAFLRRRLLQGGQAYVVLPFVEATGRLQVAALEREGEEARRRLAGVPCGFVHGRMPPEERQETMERFGRGEIRVLIATSVIEVGVDVAAADVMIIESAERFGLAQLHQLRGRVGRGQQGGFCVALHGSLTREARARLEVFAKTTDGFAIAQADLSQRGPGDIEGWRQSGLPRLQVARLDRDMGWLEAARSDARSLVGSPDDPEARRFLSSIEAELEEEDAPPLAGG